MKTRFTWLKNGFIDKELYAPFVVKLDNDYYEDLCERYEKLKQCAVRAGSDDESNKIITKYTKKVKEALRDYYKGNISTCHLKIKNLVKECIDNELAVNTINNSSAFVGISGTEIQFFRARANTDAIPFEAKDMLHLPFKLRSKTGNYRFSLPGVPSLYLGNSSYVCWLELGRPSEHDFMVSPVLLDGTQRIFNLAVMLRDFHALGDFDIEKAHCWLKLLVLMIATSYRVEEKSRIFHSEYIISQSIMSACMSLGLDGVVYYSKRVEDEIFSGAAINLALFVPFKRRREYSEICKHIKIGDSFNYALFRQLGSTETRNGYNLRCVGTGFINNIGNYSRQYSYQETEFCKFDKFLFSGWDKDSIEFGNAINARTD